MSRFFMSGWTVGADDGLRGSPDDSANLSCVDTDYVRGYKEGYRIGKAYRDADKG